VQPASAVRRSRLLLQPPSRGLAAAKQLLKHSFAIRCRARTASCIATACASTTSAPPPTPRPSTSTPRSASGAYRCSSFCSPTAACCAWLLPQLIPCGGLLAFLPLLQGAHPVSARVLLAGLSAAPLLPLLTPQPSTWSPLPAAHFLLATPTQVVDSVRLTVAVLQAELQGVPGGAAGPGLDYRLRREGQQQLPHHAGVRSCLPARLCKQSGRSGGSRSRSSSGTQAHSCSGA